MTENIQCSRSAFKSLQESESVFSVIGHLDVTALHPGPPMIPGTSDLPTPFRTAHALLPSFPPPHFALECHTRALSPRHHLEQLLLFPRHSSSSRPEHSPSTFSPWKDQVVPAIHPLACPLPFPSAPPAVSGAPPGSWQDPLSCCSSVRLSCCSSGSPAWKACSPAARQLPPLSACLGCRQGPAGGLLGATRSS